MKLAIMQPYIFPYVGYFQLINAVDVFLIYDDVNFIKGGWINRNRIVANGHPIFFTVPLKDSSSFKKISETRIDELKFIRFKSKFLKTIKQSYSKAVSFKDFYPKLENFINNLDCSHISSFSYKSILFIFEYLNQDVNIIRNSEVLLLTNNLKAHDRIIKICELMGASQYINLSGGIDLYDKETFAENSVDLKFLTSNSISYNQNINEFSPNLSIIDVIMHNSVESVLEYLNKFKLL